MSACTCADYDPACRHDSHSGGECQDCGASAFCPEHGSRELQEQREDEERARANPERYVPVRQLAAPGDYQA